LSRYLRELEALIRQAQQRDMGVIVIKTPLPADFRRRLPEEQEFDAAMGALLRARRVPFHDFSAAMDEPRFYFDTDHLNRTGLLEFFQRYLGELLIPKSQ
jgi:hypothetical protein